MKKINKQIIVFILLYLLFGLANQIYGCYLNSTRPVGDIGIPCAGVVWTPIVLTGWPLLGIFDLFHGFVIRGLINLLLFALTIIIPKTLFRK